MKITPRAVAKTDISTIKPFDVEFAPKDVVRISPHTTFVGIDPGTRNIGIALVNDTVAKAFDIHLPAMEDRPACMLLIQAVIHHILEAEWEHGLSYGRWLVNIEDAAFGMKFGQVQLAEGRSAAILYFASTAKVSLTAPMKVRKLVFGNAKIKAHERWKIAPNAGAALSCAVYSIITQE